MPPEIMGSQMNANHLSCLVHNPSPGGVGYWKDPLIGSNPFGSYVFPEAISNLLGDKDNVSFLSTLGASEGKFAVFDVSDG